jgi:predicted MFS family arabinose efflux permease
VSEAEQKRRRGTPYRELLQIPGLAWEALTGLLAQFTQSAGPVGMVLVMHEATGSLALAGGVVAGFSVGAGVARPLQGRVIDRRGPASVFAACAALHLCALVVLVIAASRVPVWALVGLGCLAGIGLPPVSAVMRVAWGRRAPEEARTAAYSLVYLTQELAILIGPLMLGLLVAVASASTALLSVAAVAAAGTFVFAARLHALPRQRSRQNGGGVLGSAAMRIVLAIALALGGALGAIEVGVPAFASAHGAPAASGILIAMLSLGGIVGAVVYGGKHWTADPASRLVVLLGLLTISLVPVLPARTVAMVGALLFLVGTVLNPAITTTSLLVDRTAPSAAAEAFGWISTALGAGAAAGNALAGGGSQRFGASSSFFIALLAACSAVILAALARRSVEVRRS